MRPVLLALRALGIGDFVTAIPALRGLRAAFPRHELVLATPAALTPLADATGVVDRIFATPPYVRRPIDSLNWTGPRPAVAVNLHGKGPQSHRALLATDPVQFTRHTVLWHGPRGLADIGVDEVYTAAHAQLVAARRGRDQAERARLALLRY